MQPPNGESYNNFPRASTESNCRIRCFASRLSACGGLRRLSCAMILPGTSRRSNSTHSFHFGSSRRKGMAGSNTIKIRELNASILMAPLVYFRSSRRASESNWSSRALYAGTCSSGFRYAPHAIPYSFQIGMNFGRTSVCHTQATARTCARFNLIQESIHAPFCLMIVFKLFHETIKCKEGR